MTFKMITRQCSQSKLVRLDAAGCPRRSTSGIAIPNYSGFDLGVVPMSRAFASSCSTTFAELSSRLPPRGLTQAARRYRIGLDCRWTACPR